VKFFKWLFKESKSTQIEPKNLTDGDKLRKMVKDYEKETYLKAKHTWELEKPRLITQIIDACAAEAKRGYDHYKPYGFIAQWYGYNFRPELIKELESRGLKVICTSPDHYIDLIEW
jgi:hypothetical protein